VVNGGEYKTGCISQVGGAIEVGGSEKKFTTLSQNVMERYLQITVYFFGAISQKRNFSLLFSGCRNISVYGTNLRLLHVCH